jgi:MHS family alpha-ketoglutarate permease-like MFS transporter
LDQRRRLRSIFGGSVGNLVEWYDWYIYSAMSLYFAKAFFPTGDETAQLLNAAAVFAAGFLVRPLGGWLLGLYADKRGRKSALLLSVVMMCAGSLMIALTPGYAEIGVAAPVLLVAARLLQGLSVGGEYGTSATYMSEMATSANRGFWASFQYVTLVGGQLVALGVLLVLQATMTEAEIEAWGWRIPFVIGALCAVVALYLRRGIEETESFAATSPAERRGLLRRLLAHPRELAIVVGLTAGGTLAFYTFTTYMQKFLVNSAGFSKGDATLISAGSLFFFMLLQPAFGALSDRIGRRTQLIIFGVLGLLTTVPIMTALGTADSRMEAFLLVSCALAVNACYSSISGVVKAELFPTEIRALGVGLPYAFAVSLFGGTAEYVALWFKSIGREAWFFWYVTGAIGLSLVVYWLMPETRKHSAIAEG